MTKTLKNLPVPLLLLVSGFCGISYELLYSKLLGNLLGNQFTINATVLLTFLAGIGIGTLHAHRFLRHLWLVEAGIGIYAILLTLLYPELDHLIYAYIPALGTSIFASAAVALIVLAIPSFLVGCSLPLFAAYLGESRRQNVFAITYSIYNIGAVLTALALEFVILRQYGLIPAMQGLAILNLIVAGSLISLTKFQDLNPRLQTSNMSFPRHLLISLFVVSMASAIFQLLSIKIFEFVFGPFNETFALVLAVVLFGIAFGSMATAQFKLNYKKSLSLVLIGLVLFLVLFGPVTTLYAALYPVVVNDYGKLVALKLAIVFLLMFLPSVGFGATVPALLSMHKDLAKDSGFLLFTSSMGNVLGFILMTFFLHQYFDYGPLIICIAALVFVALVLQSGIKSIAAALCGFLLLACLFVAQNNWQESRLYISHKNFRSIHSLNSSLQNLTDIEKFKGAQDVFAIVSRNDQPFFFINGYISIPLNSTSEKIVGVISSMLAPRLDQALVLGVGSGATAGTVGLLFDKTEAVEINKIILDNLGRMSEYNFDIETRSNINLVHDDGIRYVKNSKKQYSLILNTVTSPQFFSSSKLYTKDFFEVIKQKLTPDGVYVTWADSKIGSDGMDVVLKTLDNTFEHCALAYIRSNYFLLVCSQTQVSLRQFESIIHNATLSEYFRDNNLPMEFLPYLVLSSDALNLQFDSTAEINRLDFPILEHLMARIPSGDMADFRSLLLSPDNFQMLEQNMRQGFDWQAGEFVFFAENRLRSSSLKRIIRRVVAADITDLDKKYIKAINHYAEALNKPSEFAEAFDTLLAMDECHAAQSLHHRLEIQGKTDYQIAHYQIGKCHYYAQQYTEAYDALGRQWQTNQYRKAPLYIARVLIKQHRFEDALIWLDKAKQTQQSAAPRIAYYSGFCHEQLGHTADAITQYTITSADRRNDKYASARRRLSHLKRQDPLNP